MDNRHIHVYDLNMNLVAILENAFNIGYTKRFNEVWGASFSLPADDPKLADIKPLHFVELFENGERVDLFRIMPQKTVRSAAQDVVHFECEHVLATLLDEVIPEYDQFTNIETRDVLAGILGYQDTPNWQLGQVDFTRYFHYAWDGDNLLSAIFSVPQPFDEPFQFTWDTSTYPWTINLIRMSDEITAEIRYAKNMRGITKTEDPTNIVTRLYARGYGEGVNQLTIEEVNPTGKKYIDADTISLYGIKSYVWTDRRFENAESLYNSAKALLNKWSVPKITYEVDAADLSAIDEYGVEKFEIGKLVRVVDEELGINVDVRVMAIEKSDIVGAPYDVRLELANRTEDIGDIQADVERKQQINETYAQGATNIDSHNFNDNCDPEHPAVIEFYFPQDMINVNESRLTFKTSKFRAYSKATKSAPSSVVASASGGGTTATSSSGGGTTATTSAGGGWVGMTNLQQEITSGIDPSAHPNTHGTYGGGVADHYHKIYPHQHEVGLPDHSHDVTIPNHTHTVTIPNHTHDVTIPSHQHDIDYGIYEDSNTPTSLTIKVDGNTVPVSGTSGEGIDLVPYLAKDSSGKIVRGWHTLEITPNALARINAVVINRFFIQSRTGGKY
jgi:phage minor structural protein